MDFWVESTGFFLASWVTGASHLFSDIELAATRPPNKRPKAVRRAVLCLKARKTFWHNFQATSRETANVSIVFMPISSQQVTLRAEWEKLRACYMTGMFKD